ncbi:MAG: M1 family metallopeptidase [Bacteroidota bacterium]
MLPFLVFSQRQENIDFTKINAEIEVFPFSNSIRGNSTYALKSLKRTDVFFLDAVGIQFSKVLLNGKKVKYTYDGKKVFIKKRLSKNSTHQLELEYMTQPKQTVYFVDWKIPDSLQSGNRHLREPYRGLKSSMNHKLLDVINKNTGQIWTQGQGKYTSHWLPSVDDMNDKIEFDIAIWTDNEYKVAANGTLVEKTHQDGWTKWEFDMNKPMSSYLVAFAIGNFNKKIIKSKSGVPIELYYEPKDSLKYEPTYRYTKKIFDFLEEEIGVGYPWQNYKQVPVQDFLYAGMENTTCTIFSNQYVIDTIAFVDKNYVNVNAHELAHQWFGNLVTEESGEHHWLHEGFATYYAYLAERELFGEDHFYWKLYQTAKTLHNLSENEGGEALTDPNANSLTFYEKGAWALVALRERMGNESFKQGIQDYLDTYAYSNATITDFLTEMEVTAQKELTDFKETWLESEEFPWAEAKGLLTSKNESIRLFFELQDRSMDTAEFNGEDLIGILGKEMPIPFKREFLFKHGTQIPDSILGQFIDGQPLKVRQAVAQVIPRISNELLPAFEAMLKDQSYLTQEIILFKLWQAFPERQHQYLAKTDGVVGLPNKNVRLLWLTLALITEDYRPETKSTFYNELNTYTNSNYHFEVRQLAFQYLFQIGGLNKASIQNLFEATKHHVWQFKKSSRNLLREINKSEEGKNLLSILQDTLSKADSQLLNTILNP